MIYLAILGVLLGVLGAALVETVFKVHYSGPWYQRVAARVLLYAAWYTTQSLLGWLFSTIIVG